jgi:hypothetical protein
MKKAEPSFCHAILRGHSSKLPFVWHSSVECVLNPSERLCHRGRRSLSSMGSPQNFQRFQCQDTIHRLKVKAELSHELLSKWSKERAVGPAPFPG